MPSGWPAPFPAMACCFEAATSETPFGEIQEPQEAASDDDAVRTAAMVEDSDLRFAAAASESPLAGIQEPQEAASSDELFFCRTLLRLFFSNLMKMSSNAKVFKCIKPMTLCTTW